MNFRSNFFQMQNRKVIITLRNIITNFMSAIIKEEKEEKIEI
jgi:hypothetical protein